MPAALPTPAPYGSFTLTQWDDLHDHAHRILLHGTLVANDLEDYATKDTTIEALQVLVVEMITHAEALETLLHRLPTTGGAS